MPTNHSTTDLLVDCIYCRLRKPGSCEHVIQDALGGVDVLTNVCQECNHHLASLDRALVVDSGLAIFVRRDLRGVGPYCWDVDTARGGLLLEARTTPHTDSITLLPQVIFDKRERLVYCDEDDWDALGPEGVQDRLYTRLRCAFLHHQLHGPNARKRDHKGRDMLKFAHLDRIRDCYRYPPRISCPVT